MKIAIVFIILILSVLREKVQEPNTKLSLTKYIFNHMMQIKSEKMV
jgi:hypothetical protein